MKAIIIHGNQGGTGNDQWLPWLAAELEKNGIHTVHPTFPDNETAKRSLWVPYLKELGADEDTVLIGWSSGAVAAMRFAEENKIKGSVLIGACHTDLNDPIETVSGYYDEPWNWNAIKENQEWIAQFASIDDPVIPIEESRFVRDQLNTEYYEYPDKLHFGWPNAMPTFPELLAVILKHKD